MKAEETNIIFVLAKDGTPLMPTKRTRHIAKLLKKGMAKVISRKPFVVQMKYNVGQETQPLYGGTDPGRTNIANGVINQEGVVFYKDKIESCNKDVPKHMAERKAHRQASRRGERLARKRLAKKHNTTTTFPDGRLLPGCEEPVMMKGIINTEARFNNRKRPEGWLTPTARHLVRTHVNQIKYIKKILPVIDWSLEMNKFTFMKMEDNTVWGIDYQNGRMKGFACVDDYIDYIQDYKCACCGNPIQHHHHIKPRHEGGSDLPENIVGLCNECHDKVHTGKMSFLAIGEKKKYQALSVLNQVIPYIYQELVDIFGEEYVHCCTDYETAKFRELNGIQKDHPDDAVCIVAISFVDSITDNAETYEIKQLSC